VHGHPLAGRRNVVWKIYDVIVTVHAAGVYNCGLRIFRFSGACRGGCGKGRGSGKMQRKSTCEAVL